MSESFAERHGIERAIPEITITDDFPVEHRTAVIQIADQLNVPASSLRKAMLKVLVTGIDTTNRSHNFIWEDLVLTLPGCDWPDVYEIAQEIYEVVPVNQQQEYERLLNRFFERNGFGWMMRDGLIEYRGAEPFVVATKAAEKVLASRGFDRAAREVREAMVDLSRRPMPDLTGAATHAFGALEAVAREDTGQHKKTLGQLVPDLDLQPPLDEVMSKLWGFASETVRHISEKKDIEAPEAEFAVTVACALATLVASKQPPSTPSVTDADDLPFE